MKPMVHVLVRVWMALVVGLAMPVAQAQSFSIDTSNASAGPLTGLWYDPSQTGWELAIIQEYGVIAATVNTFDSSGKPTWYAVSNCEVVGNGCTGTLYQTSGGSAPTMPWNGAKVVVAPVGTLTLAFSDLNTGTMTISLNKASATKAIVRDVFATMPASVATGGAPASMVLSTALNSPSAPSTTLVHFMGLAIDPQCAAFNCAPKPSGSSCALGRQHQIQVADATAAYQAADGRILWIGISDPNNGMRLGVPNLSSTAGPILVAKFSDRFSNAKAGYPSWAGTSAQNKANGMGSVTITAATSTSLELRFSQFVLSGSPASISITGTVTINCDPRLAQ